MQYGNKASQENETREKESLNRTMQYGNKPMKSKEWRV